MSNKDQSATEYRSLHQGFGDPGQLDPRSQAFHHNWTRPKRETSQVNGHTEMSRRHQILRAMAKAHRI